MKNDIWKSGELAECYLNGIRGAIPLAEEQIETMLRVVRKDRASVGQFLDVGCGDGALGHAISELYPDARGVFLDFSKAMLEAARNRLPSSNSQYTFIEQDYGDPRWVDRLEDRKPFDAIVSGYSIHHQTDVRKREIFSEIFQLLNRGGVFINIEHVASRSSWVQNVHDEHFLDSLHAYHRRNDPEITREKIAESYYDRPDKEANILALVEDQCKWLREAGFVHVDCYMKMFELAVFGGVRPE